MSCEHTVAKVGDKDISEANLRDAYCEWNSEVDRFNELNSRYVVQPPPEFKLANFCPKCGEKLDVEAHRKALATPPRLTSPQFN